MKPIIFLTTLLFQTAGCPLQQQLASGVRSVYPLVVTITFRCSNCGSELEALLGDMTRIRERVLISLNNDVGRKLSK